MPIIFTDIVDLAAAIKALPVNSYIF